MTTTKPKSNTNSWRCFCSESWFLWDDVTNQDSDDNDLTSQGVFLQSSHGLSASRRRFPSYRRRSSRTTQTSDGGAEEAGDDGGDGDRDGEGRGDDEIFLDPTCEKPGASVNGETAGNDGEGNGVEVR